MNMFKPLELNKENVDSVFQYCLANDHDPTNDIYESKIFMNENDNTISFSKTRLDRCEKDILYLIGQMKTIHTGKALHMFELDDLGYTYQNIKWTHPSFRLFVFPSLTAYFGWSSPFIEIDGKYYFHGMMDKVKVTLSPNDPNFEEWWKIHKKEWMD